jgi:putative flippase GtrA
MRFGSLMRAMFGFYGPAPNPHPLIGRTARYAIVGAICAATGNAVLILGDLAGGHYAPLMVLSFAIVTPLGYLLHCGFTFNERPSLRGLLGFVCGTGIGFPLSFLVMAILCSGLGLRVVIAAPITTAVLFLWNFSMTHWVILGRPQHLP